MPKRRDVLDLPVPRSACALMQHLQFLVSRQGYLYWCGGSIEPEKLADFVQKMHARYRVALSPRMRAYDRQCGRALASLVVFPHGDKVLWWVLSDGGAGGLADPTAPDFRVSRHAMRADGHVVFDDYVLVYATKTSPRMVLDARSGTAIEILKDVSTWTWKIRSPVVTQLKADVDAYCKKLDYGKEPDAKGAGWGLRCFLLEQRQRPLFAGVRWQVVGLHRYAKDAWQPRRGDWVARHAKLATIYGNRAGTLTPIERVTHQLPRMIRERIYDSPALTIRDLCVPKDAAAPRR